MAGYIGVRKVPTAIEGAGIWLIREVAKFRKDKIWPIVDPYWSNVSLLLHMEGANNGTIFTDVSPTPKTITRYNAITSTAQSKWGNGSGYFDGSGDYLSVADSNDWDVSGDYTVEFYFYLLEQSGIAYTKCILATMPAGQTTGFFVGHYLGNLTIINSSQPALSGSGSLLINTWYHLALVWYGSSFKVYFNGVVLYSGATGTTSTSNPLIIGNSSPVDVNRYFYGHIQDLRITKGVARYTANFTPPARLLDNQ